ncbi:MAG: efflux RND transporter permease subunit [Breznakibacter sp.]
MNLTEISIKRPSLIIVIFAVLILGGAFAYTKLNYELTPEMSQPTLMISTAYPGAAPANVEQSVSKKIEDVLSGVNGLSSITTRSTEGISLITAEFEMETDIDAKEQEVQRKLNNIMADLPDDVKTPSISKLSPSDMPVMQLTATSTLDNSQFYDLVKNEVRPQIQQIPGVGEVTLIGGQEREIQVNTNKDKLDFYGISILSITEAINNANLEFPAGKVKTREDQMTVRLIGKFTSVEQLRNLEIIPVAGGTPVKLHNIANVVDMVKEPASVNRYNGINGIGILIKKQDGGNAVEISNQVKERLAHLESKYASDNLDVIIAEDTADFTMEAADGVIHDLVIAIFLVALIMVLFLHSMRDSLIVLLALPTSIITTFIAMYFFGYSLNLMTLLALSLVVGVLVDDSIVVLENIHRHLHMGKHKRQAAIDGRREIGFSAIAITMVDVVVFLPLALVNSVVSDLLSQFAVTIVVSVLVSLFVCYTLTPWLASRFGKITVLNPQNYLHKVLIAFENQLHSLTEWYGNALKWVFNHKLIFTSVILLLFLATGMVMSMGILGNEMVSEGDRGKFKFALEYDKNTTVGENNIRTKAIEDYILQLPEVISVFSNVAGASTTSIIATVGSDYKSELTISLIDKEKRNQKTTHFMIKLAKEVVQKFPGVKVSPSAVGMVDAGDPIQIILNSEDAELMMKAARDLKHRIEAMPGTINTTLSVEEGNPEVQINIDREKMTQVGLNINMVGATLQNSFAGNTDAKYRVGTNEYDINIKLDEFNKRSADDVKNLSFVNNKGQVIRLSQFAEATQGSGPSLLERKDRRQSVTVKSNVLGITYGIIADQINQSLIDDPLPLGVDMKWDGSVKMQGESFGAIGIALLAALILMYLVMVALYDSFLHPFVVLFSIPVALIGALLALNLAKSSMSIFALLGILMLLGLVSKNAILIVDYTNQHRNRGTSTWDALITAGKTRLRPILMTTIAMVIGMLPIALSSSAGSEWKSGIGWVLIGGLTSSMFLTIFLVPTVYLVFDKIKQRLFPTNEDKSVNKNTFIVTSGQLLLEENQHK